MNSQEVLIRLRENEAFLRARGIRHVALFGSVARGDNHADSDIDILLEFDSESHITIFDYVDLKEYIAGLFQCRVDVVNRDALKPYVRTNVTTETRYAF
ncbi:nucleotidyltransferase family protein [Candidatus Magnetominusculus xianensis]|uniref:DNA polymerase III subunit beta n=1 Tax=Candidatus Magnetominusculus xianensis TaxID=1748249 RepID=A0ABR5SCD3_9BACT|nr:nucleotidyltransferase family protein [Candidatus Magnetominusculus xianensis]KWT79703.1 DNA polymerase III subunit beta [Candidatus Magnetominusculus xianensis]MBF0404757.1 nucleotidyltransferase family protein [Nitrospirota bacterium]